MNARETGSMLVACLCAGWCSACRAYRPVFEEVARTHSGSRFLWVDIEDAAELFEHVDFDVFPAVLIGDGDRALFFGAVAPQRDVLRRLLVTPMGNAIAAPPEMDIVRLLERLQAIASGDSSMFGIQRLDRQR